MNKIFSVPLNPKIHVDDYKYFVEFLQNHKDLIYDVYFTSRIAPFNKDAMGDIFQNSQDEDYLIQAALNIQNVTGIPVSATFNNIEVPPTQQNLDLFIQNFKPLYDSGIRTATIPHTHWLATGQIKAAFPELKVKNTILRDVRTAQEIVNLAKYGFDYINLDRDLMRDRDTLLRLKEAKEWIKENTGKEIHFSLLANEGCLGQCPMMVEHFQFNNTRNDSTPQYFNDPISRVSCPKWDVEDPSIQQLKTADLPPWKQDWEEFINDLGIDVFKMHGRESIERWHQTLEIIKQWKNNNPILIENFEQYLKETNLEDKPIQIWREKIKNCKFDCWECQYCDKVYEARTDLDYSDLVKHTVSAIHKSGVPKVYNNIPGLTSPRVQTLLNYLAQGCDTYMEIGSAMGSTLCAVMKDNPITVFAVDNWQQNIQDEKQELNLPNNNLDTFMENVKEHKGQSIVNVIDDDMFNVDTALLTNKIKMWFYDGPHDQETTKRAVEYYWNTFAQETILVFDDANWEGVVYGAKEGIESSGGQILYEKLLLNDTEDKTQWWNGVYVLVVRKI